MNTPLRTCYYIAQNEQGVANYKKALFHCFGMTFMMRETPQGSIPVQHTVAIIEDAKTGEVHQMHPEAIKFKRPNINPNEVKA